MHALLSVAPLYMMPDGKDNTTNTKYTSMMTQMQQCTLEDMYTNEAANAQHMSDEAQRRAVGADRRRIAAKLSKKLESERAIEAWRVAVENAVVTEEREPCIIKIESERAVVCRYC